MARVVAFVNYTHSLKPGGATPHVDDGAVWREFRASDGS